MSSADRDSPAQILESVFGYSTFRGRQAEIIETVLKGQHVLVLAPTGMGKSVCYQIPALCLANTIDSKSNNSGPSKTVSIVISPLIALMQDQVDKLTDKGVSATFINSSLSAVERNKRYQAIENGQFELVYVTPERFRKDEFLSAISHRAVRLLAVDEAHCISQWGHDFRPDYSRIGEIRRLLDNPVTIALTATATPDVQKDIVKQLELGEDPIEIFKEGIDRPNLILDVEHTWSDDEKLDWILKAFRSLGPDHEREDDLSNDAKLGEGNGIVYFSLIRVLEKFSEELRKKNVPHLVYHGDLNARERRRLQEEFMASTNCMVLATNAFGLGIDKEDIRFVLHAEIPGSLESYYQEIGRAGRDGKRSFCRLLYAQSDLETQMEFIRWSHPDPQFYRRVYDFVENENESLNAFGIEWLRERLHARNRHDFRLETALNMLERFDAVAGFRDQQHLEIVGPLPEQLLDDDLFEQKLKIAQSKLLALVQYANHDGDRRQLIHQYFGVES